jgi:sulfofructose kinase
MNKRWDVIGLGAVSVDDLIFVDHYPQLNTKVIVQSRYRQGGGLAGTALVAAARLGAKVAYCGVLGEDELSQYSRQEFTKEEVDCSLIADKADARPLYSTIIVHKPTGQRSILFSLEGFTEPDDGIIINAFSKGCQVLFVDHTVPSAALCAMRLAHADSIPVVADIEADTFPKLADFIGQVDHLILGVELANRLTGAQEPEVAVRSLASSQRACCVVTVGDQGCWYSEWGGEAYHFPAFSVPVVDTTGCGDVFHGAYAASLSCGKEIRSTIEFASAAAAIKATQPGGRAGIPTRSQVEEFLRGK